jgi:16S rRNA U516 pseudouridylate synthase RsuA-like enzyme
MNKERLKETIHSFSQDEEKRKELIEILRNTGHSRKVLRYFEAVKERLLEIRRMRYGYG